MGFFQRSRSTSPYLKDGRLAEVIAAISVLGSHRQSEGYIDMWSGQLSRPPEGDRPQSIERWSSVFSEHPEFFFFYTVDSETKKKAALRLRYANKTIDRATRQPHANVASLTKQQRVDLTSLELDPETMNSLISVAINLHSAEISRRADARFWFQFIGPALGLAGGILVALLTVWIGKQGGEKPTRVEAKLEGVALTATPAEGGQPAGDHSARGNAPP